MNNKQLLIYYLRETNKILKKYTGFDSYINEMNIFELNKWDNTRCRILLCRISDVSDGKAFPWCLLYWNDCKECTYIKYNIHCGYEDSIYQKIINKLKDNTNYKEIIDIPEIKTLISNIKKKILVT